ncbi:hypothetical protein [uncultured Parasphingopyxis sp.]|uniref:hypothetical protein n=1 Tax=uncultured Parasphingopyxis sp. TaxID=1547918 RepID=UPI002610CA8C|nr:hypothetical protein [uncultured Parasphingopyxis sp.]
MIDNPFAMVVAIVLIVSIAGVMRAKYKAGLGEDENGNTVRLTDPDADKLRDEVRTLKERIAVLERIATDRSNRLEDEIEALRDETR